MKTTCETCGGSGQIGHFQGVSRFVITWDECGDCNGTGQVENDDCKESPPPGKSPDNNEAS